MSEVFLLTSSDLQKAPNQETQNSEVADLDIYSSGVIRDKYAIRTSSHMLLELVVTDCRN